MSNIAIHVKLDEQQMKDVHRMFDDIDKNLANKVLSRALNRTLKGVKTDISTNIRTVLKASKKAVDDLITIEKATQSSITGTIRVRGRNIPIGEFSPRQTKAGVTVRLYEGKPKREIRSGFIATMKNTVKKSNEMVEHTGVFRRVNRFSSRKDKYVSKNIAYGRLPKIYRLPIEKIWGPRLTTVFLDDKVFAPTKKNISDRLQTDLNREINYSLESHK